MKQTASLSATYAGPHAPDNLWWVRLEQIPVTTDAATVGETANLLDALYQLDPCTAVEPEATEDGLTTEDVAAAASETLDLAVCDIDPDGSCEVQIKVIRSHQTEPYRLHVAGGAVVETVVVNEEVVQSIAVPGATEITLDYPVVDAFASAWQSDLVTASGSALAIKRNGNVLYWAEAATGTLRAAYLTVYDLATIKVAGVDGEQGKALVRVVFHGQAEEMTPELPEPAEDDASLCPSTSWKIDPNPDRVTCYQSVTETLVCECSKAEVSSSTYDKVVPCPEWGPTRCPGPPSDCMHLLGSGAETRYVECEIALGYAVSDREFYKEKCCEYPTVPLPRCPEKTESYKGGKPIQHGEAYWRALYGENTRFIPVSPEKGCGKHITRQIIEEKSCCEDVLLLAWDETISAKVLVDMGIVAVAGGMGPFIWELVGEHFSFSAEGIQRSKTTDTNSVAVYLEDFACGFCKVTCTDFCEQEVSGYVRSTEGRWRDATTEELLELPRNTMYTPDFLFKITDYTVDFYTSYNPPVDTLPTHLPPDGHIWRGGVVMKDLGHTRIYAWYGVIWDVNDNVGDVNAMLEAYVHGSDIVYPSTMWLNGELVVVDYINVYSPIISGPPQTAINSYMAAGLLEPSFSPVWSRSPEMIHTWYATGLPFRDDPITTAYDPSIRAAGYRIGTEGFGVYPKPRVYTWSCE